MIPPFGTERGVVGNEKEHDCLKPIPFFKFRKHLVRARESRRARLHHLVDLCHGPARLGVRYLEFEREGLIDGDAMEQQSYGLRGRQSHRRERRTIAAVLPVTGG